MSKQHEGGIAIPRGQVQLFDTEAKHPELYWRKVKDSHDTIEKDRKILFEEFRQLWPFADYQQHFKFPEGKGKRLQLSTTNAHAAQWAAFGAQRIDHRIINKQHLSLSGT